MQSIQGIGQNHVLVTSVPDGDRGTRQTIKFARQLVAEGLRDPSVHELALYFCKAYGAQPYDEKAELEAVFDGVLDNFQYRKHVVGAQSLQPVSGMMRTRSGDCAELNLILLPSLLGTIGYPTRAVAIKADSSRPTEFSHVYIEAMTSDGEWVPMDVAREHTAFGQEPERYWQREEFDLTPTAEGSMNGYRSLPRGMGAQIVLVRKKAAFPRRGLGDDGDDGSDFAQTFTAATPAILGGIAQVVKAANTPGVAYSSAGVPIGTTGTNSPTVSASVSPILIIALVVGVGLFAFGGRR